MGEQTLIKFPQVIFKAADIKLRFSLAVIHVTNKQLQLKEPLLGAGLERVVFPVTILHYVLIKYILFY